jgi:hypothetical protein
MFCNRKILERKWEHIEAVHQLFIDFKKAYDSVGRDVFYIILIEFGVPMKLTRLILMCLKKCIGKHLPYNFGTQNVLKQIDAISSLLLKFV